MTQAMASPIRVTFFGDSICVGQGVSIYRGWVTRLAQDLDKLCPQLGRPVLVTNASMNGRTTRQALEDMPYSVQSPGVDILLVQFGFNDCNYWLTDRGVPRVSGRAFAANLHEILARGRLSGAKRLLMNNNHPTTRNTAILPGTSITYEESNQAYNELVREVARGEGADVRFIDVEDAFRRRLAAGASMDEFLLPDGLHLSVRGHDIYFELMRPALKEAALDLVSVAPAKDDAAAA